MVLPDTASGDFFLIVIPDAHNWVFAAVTPGARAIHISPKPPADLEVTALSMEKDTVKSGSLFQVSWTVTNNGYEQTLYKSGTNETGCTCYQDRIIDAYDESLALRAARRCFAIVFIHRSTSVEHPSHGAE